VENSDTVWAVAPPPVMKKGEFKKEGQGIEILSLEKNKVLI